MARDDTRDGADPPRMSSPWKQPGRPPSPDDEQASTASTVSCAGESRGRSARDERLVTRCVELDQYRKDYRAQKYARLSIQRKRDMFGSSIMPIFVPLARGETLAMYEQRFIEWLRNEHRAQLDDFRGSQGVFRERNLRIAFANANVDEEVMFDPYRKDYTPEKSKREHPRSRSRSASRDGEYSSKRKREREDESDRRRYESYDSARGSRREEVKDSRYGQHNRSHEDERQEKRPREPTKEAEKAPRAIRICDYDEPLGNPTSTQILKAHLACGCTTCLFAAMGKMDKKLAEIESKHTTEAEEQQVIDLT